MKKISILLSFVLFCITLISCNSETNDNSDNINNPNDNDSFLEEVKHYNNPFIPIENGFQSIKLDKQLYELADTIVVDIFNANSNDYVAIFDYNKEPDQHNSYKRKKVGDNKSVAFSISELELSAGDYAVCLYNNKSWYLYDRVEFQIDDEDKNDYRILNASFNTTNNNKVLTATLTIYPSSNKLLTYSIYWAKDGKRLEEYTDLARVKVANSTSGIKVEFNQNMFMPNEANQLEIAVTEGKSTSYFLDVDDTLKLEKSIYRFNYQVLTDIHSNPDYGYWSSHFFRALTDIKCLSGNTSGIFTVGDNTDMGGVQEYAHMFSIIDEVFKERPNISFTVGNHDYMYFSEEVGGFQTAVQIFEEMTGAEKYYYTKEINGHKCIFLSSDQKNTQGTINSEQFDWFKNELSKIDKSEFAFIFVHQPFYNTTSGTLPNQNWYGMNNVADEIKLLLQDYPNVLVFTGHTHYSLECYKTTNFGNGRDANYVNNASVAYLVDDNYEYTVGGQCNFVEVYEDYLIIKGRDLYEGKWISNAQFVCYLY